MSRTRQHTKDTELPSRKMLARMSNASYKRLRAHRERTRLRNELADIERYEDDLDHEFIKWDKRWAKHLGSWWY